MNQDERDELLYLVETECLRTGERLATTLNEILAANLTLSVNQAINEHLPEGTHDTDLLLPALAWKTYIILSELTKKQGLGWQEVFFNTLDRKTGKTP